MKNQLIRIREQLEGFKNDKDKTEGEKDKSEDVDEIDD